MSKLKQLRNHQSESLSSLATAIRGIINLPTGTGKSLIQSRSIVEEIRNNSDTKVYVILSPRILLSNQLLRDVRDDLLENEIDAQFMIVHSGRNNDDLSAEDRVLMAEFDIPFRQTPSSTRHTDIQETYNKAVREEVSLVISGTYHSAERLRGAGIPIEIIYCDEAHYLVQEQFNWIVADPFPSKRAYYFTATIRETPSEEGMGMNNTNLFGEVLYQEIPLNMIEAGEMVRPRLHLVDMSEQLIEDTADGYAVADAFNEHRSMVNVGAKLLVVAKDGSDHLDSIATHPEIQRLTLVRPNFHIFDISSCHGPRINGEKVNRQQFLTQLRDLTDTDEAIIIHHDILTEGIDVPGITGVMPLIGQTKSKFLQTLGRATRLHIEDRKRLYAETLRVNDLRHFVKDYAYLIVPVYGDFGDDFRAEIKGYIDELRTYGFNPAEDVVIRPNRGRRTPEPIEMVTEPTRAIERVQEITAEILHELESEDEANVFDNAMYATKSVEDMYDTYANLA